MKDLLSFKIQVIIQINMTILTLILHKTIKFKKSLHKFKDKFIVFDKTNLSSSDYRIQYYFFIHNIYS